MLDMGRVTHTASTRDGSVWFVTDGKLSRFDGKHFRRDMGTKAMEILRERTGSGLS